MREANGRFYFKLTTSGNLLGEYSNQHPGEPRAEGANRISTKQHGSGSPGFCGSYQSFWKDNAVVEAILTIQLRENSQTIYAVTWESPGGERLYTGEAMLCDDMLVGNYFSPQ